MNVQTNVTTGNRFTLTASEVIFKNVAWGDKSGLAIFATNFEAYERAPDSQFNLLFD